MTTLPSLKRAKFKTTLPSNDQVVWYTPFVTAQEKALLMAQETQDIDTILKATEDVVQECMVDGAPAVNNMPTIDLEWMLLNIRARSVSNLAELSVKDPATDETIKLTIDIDNDIEIVKEEGHTNRIDVGEGAVLIMRYPTRREWAVFLKSQGNKKELFNVLFGCVSGLVQDDEEYDFSELSFDQLIAWCDQNITDKAADELSKFFSTMPRIRYQKTYVNKNGDERKFIIEGLQSFFA